MLQNSKQHQNNETKAQKAEGGSWLWRICIAFYTVPEYYDYQENEDFYNYEYTEYKDIEEDYDMIFDKVTVYSHVNAPGGR